MSHNPTYRTFSFKKKPKDIEAGIAEYVRHACYLEGGSLIPINWMENKVFDSYDEAYAWLEKTDNGWYDNRAVVYLDTSEAMRKTGSKKLDDVRRRLQEWQKRKSDIVNTNHFADAKASLISCKACGSKIAAEYMRKRNNCPVCGKSMLSPTLLKQLARAEEMIGKLNDEYKAEEKALNKKLLNKAEKRWLVYYDYHT